MRVRVGSGATVSQHHAVDAPLAVHGTQHERDRSAAARAVSAYPNENMRRASAVALKVDVFGLNDAPRKKRRVLPDPRNVRAARHRREVRRRVVLTYRGIRGTRESGRLRLNHSPRQPFVRTCTRRTPRRRSRRARSRPRRGSRRANSADWSTSAWHSAVASCLSRDPRRRRRRRHSGRIGSAFRRLSSAPVRSLEQRTLQRLRSIVFSAKPPVRSVCGGAAKGVDNRREMIS